MVKHFEMAGVPSDSDFLRESHCLKGVCILKPEACGSAVRQGYSIVLLQLTFTQICRVQVVKGSLWREEDLREESLRDRIKNGTRQREAALTSGRMQALQRRKFGPSTEECEEEFLRVGQGQERTLLTI